MEKSKNQRRKSKNKSQINFIQTVRQRMHYDSKYKEQVCLQIILGSTEEVEGDG